MRRGFEIDTLSISSQGMTTHSLLGQTYLRWMTRLGAITIPTMRFVNIHLLPEEQRPTARRCHRVWAGYAPPEPLDAY